MTTAALRRKKLGRKRGERKLAIADCIKTMSAPLRSSSRRRWSPSIKRRLLVVQNKRLIFRPAEQVEEVIVPPRG